MQQLKTIGRELATGSQGGFGQSKEFMDLVKYIGEARSKAEEERIVLLEIETPKPRLSEPEIPKRKMEYIIRLVYVEMLGHDGSFAYIHAVKMTHDDNLLLSNAPVTSRFALPQRRSRFDHLDRQHHPEGSQVGRLPCRLQAAQVISRFLKSDSHNLKYTGIDALGRLIKISPEIAEQH
ncbi:AP-4 complex subunit epsilon [Prunus yedoensis var. nudiflora]|uniref:AP-4 complex subunit epsilon n=1 Tax=Prunus yedoensis var. nudiflora TaxID=2094558 RepID=A0A314Y7F3_PRUYE|nr:AP-4 complex subunit epsilon [Prunus yedoensis var. nudiflora]